MDDKNVFTPDLGNVVEETNNDIGFGQNNELIVTDGSIDNNANDKTYYCQNCKTTFTSSSVNASASCVFCGNQGLIKVESFVYDSSIRVIPFVKSTDDAIKEYKKHVKLNPFLPSAFRSDEVTSKIRRVYVPCSLYDLNVSGNIDFICADEVDKKTNVPIKSYGVSYTTNFDYNGLLLSEFNNFNGRLLSSINNYELGNSIGLGEMVSDIYYIKPDFNFSEMSDLVVKKAVNIVKDEVNHKLKKVKKNNINTMVNSKKLFLLPVYYLKTDYDGRDYYYLMNGQTGRISIDLAISSPKVIIVSIVIFIIVFAITTLIAYML